MQQLEMETEERCESERTIALLRARVAELESQLQRTGTRREKIERMSSEVVDSNPYRYTYIITGTYNAYMYTFRYVAM